MSRSCFWISGAGDELLSSRPRPGGIGEPGRVELMEKLSDEMVMIVGGMMMMVAALGVTTR